jgi:CBS domain-containing protein
MATQTIEKFVKQVVTASPSESLGAIARRMEQHNVGAVVIVEGQRPVGIVSDRDLGLHVVKVFPA